MPGRLAQARPLKEILGDLGFNLTFVPEYRPRYNIAPTQPLAVLLNDSKPKVDFAVWGLIPRWSKDPLAGNRMINARAETLEEKPSFRGLYKHSRCLIFADGFYEWVKKSGRSYPYYFSRPDRRTMCFAGLWTDWSGADGSEIRSVTLITTKANARVAKIHDRMPVVLSGKAAHLWMDPNRFDTKKLNSLLVPCPDEMLESYPVSEAVNSVRVDQPECVEPAGLL